jgi:hypothetical protein
LPATTTAFEDGANQWSLMLKRVVLLNLFQEPRVLKRLLDAHPFLISSSIHFPHCLC